MSRQVAPSLVASPQRTAFIHKYSKIAVAVLFQLDHQTRNAPEAGRALLDKNGKALPGKIGWIGLNVRVSVEHKIFDCQVAYTYTADKVVWQEFYYEEIPSA